MLRPCLEPGCPQLTSRTRCPAHAAERQRLVDQTGAAVHRAAYGGGWKRAARAAVKAHVAAHGWFCPGWDRPSHPAADLVVDHDVGVLCRKCNSAKAGSYDKQRARARRG